VQDDYLDNFADPETLGKIGTDIQDNKCSWLVKQALKIVMPEQGKVLEENYGRKNKDNEAKVKALYDELGLKGIYEEYEEKKVAEIKEAIARVDESKGMKKECMRAFWRRFIRGTSEPGTTVSRYRMTLSRGGIKGGPYVIAWHLKWHKWLDELKNDLMINSTSTLNRGSIVETALRLVAKRSCPNPRNGLEALSATLVHHS